MTQEEFIEKIKDIKKRCQDEINSLGVEYMKGNNPYKVGDVITVGVETIRIGRAQTVLRTVVQISPTLPTCCYYGVQLKKDGTPKKRQDPTCGIYLSNIRSKK